jgi:hypothetical protein
MRRTPSTCTLGSLVVNTQKHAFRDWHGNVTMFVAPFRNTLFATQRPRLRTCTGQSSRSTTSFQSLRRYTSVQAQASFWKTVWTSFLANVWMFLNRVFGTIVRVDQVERGALSLRLSRPFGDSSISNHSAFVCSSADLAMIDQARGADLNEHSPNG